VARNSFCDSCASRNSLLFEENFSGFAETTSEGACATKRREKKLPLRGNHRQDCLCYLSEAVACYTFKYVYNGTDNPSFE
jgi:hypothetical protein